jgi:addiction module HigA family antidote
MPQMLICLITIEEVPMPMLNPPHPGEVIRELCLDPLGLSVTAAADGLGVTRKALSELLNGHSGISPEMALRLSMGFGGSAESWIQQQALYDLAQTRKKKVNFNIKRFASA